MSNEQTPTEQCAAAIATYGRPQWVAYVPMRIVKEVPYPVLCDLLDNARLNRATDKHRVTMAWLEEHTYEHITTTQLAEQMDVSDATARKFVENNPFFFRTVKRGVWEIRNPKEDRR
jgi:hypothetical protein